MYSYKWRLFVLCLCISIVAVISTKTVRSDSARLKAIWELSSRYYTEESGHASRMEDISFMVDIWELRGEELRYFADFNEAMRIASDIFPSGSTEWLEQEDLDWSNLYIRQTVFGEDVDVAEREHSQLVGEFVATYLEIVQAVVDGKGDAFFSAEYLSERPIVIELVDKHNLKLFTPETITLLAEEIEGAKSKSDTESSSTSEASCLTIPKNHTVFAGNSSWGYVGIDYAIAKQSWSGGDCDTYILYQVGSPNLNWDWVDATHSDAQCAIWAYSGYLGARIPSNTQFRYVIFGSKATAWWGCGASVSILRDHTRLYAPTP